MIIKMTDVQIDRMSKLKEPLIDRVCPMCRVFGKNIKFMDLQDEALGISLTIVTCMTCKAVYSMNCEVGDKDEKPVP